MTLTTATASRTAIAATAPEGRSTALTTARVLTAPFPLWIAGVGIQGLEEMEVPSRVGDLFKSLPLADVGELPVGSLVNSDDTWPFYLVSLTLRTDVAGRQLGQLNLASSALSPTVAPTIYFQFANATEDTECPPPSNVLILPLMPLIKKGCDADCYIFAGLADPADQAEVEASLIAAGRAFGINNLTLGSIRLHRLGMDGEWSLRAASWCRTF
ncbi:hypothetical protein FOZ60_001286 [Perkinsus olseni]|uniref:Uncharacterized protein n=1 Tax=Perkinsus olseni TaxID=32597 RepID=A0A7J6P0T8_PEROL|nr:hypothetical protein FOZ60_001286 [Perkinsus olseni]